MAKATKTPVQQGSIPQALRPVEPEVARTKVPTTPYFMYCYRPGRYHVQHGKVVPQLAKLVILPGVNLVDSKGGHSAAVLERQKRGWTVIPEDIDGKGTSYLRTYENNHGHVVHLDRFCTVHPGATHIGDGSKAQAKWLAKLIKAGKIQPAESYVLEGMLDDLRAKISVLEDRDSRFDKPQLTKYKADERVLVEALKSLESAEEDQQEPSKKDDK